MHSANSSVAARGLVLLLAATVAMGVKQQVGDLTVKVLSKSGNMTITRANAERSSTTLTGMNDRTVKVSLVAVEEIDTANTAITGVSTKHAFYNFNRQQFLVSRIDNGKLPGTDIGAKVMTLEGHLWGVTGILHFEVYVAKESGSVAAANGTTEVRPGMVKFNLGISRWSWCGDTNGCVKDGVEKTGVFLDVKIAVQPPHQGDVAKLLNEDECSHGNATPSYDLGGARIDLPNKVLLEGKTWKDMPEGYPKITKVGTQQVITFRFPKFATRAFLYDPTIEVQSEFDVTSGSYRMLAHIHVYLACLLATRILLFARC